MKYVKRVRDHSLSGHKVADLVWLDLGEAALVVADTDQVWVDVDLSLRGRPRYSCNRETLEEATEEEYLRCLLAGRP